MKKLIFTFLLLMSVCSLFATDFTVDGIHYSTLTSSTVQVSQGTYSGNITIPSNVTFSNITYSVTSIGTSAFYGCTGLTSLTIPSSVTSIGFFAFQDCTSLTSIIIPSSITSIGQNGFYGCIGLTSIVIPSSVTSLGTNAFYGCTSLTNISIPSSVTSIGSDAFLACTGLIDIDTNNPNYASQDGILYNKTMTTLIHCPISKMGNFTIPSSVTSIGQNAFTRCSYLTSITIPYSVTSITSLAFYGCTGLNVESNNPNYASQDGLLYNKAMTTLIQCPISKTGDFTIPSSVTSVGYMAFLDCTGLTSITIHSSITSIGDYSFLGCTGLINVDAKNTKYVSLDGLLYNKAKTLLIQCPISKTGNFTIPSSVISIGQNAFYGCTDLTSITIPSSVTSIGYDVFYGCMGLTSIYTYVTVPVSLTGASVFGKVNKTSCILYVPKGSISAYKAATYWKDFVNLLEFNVSAVNNPVNSTTQITFNPASGTIQIHGTDTPAHVSVYNLNGALVKSGVVSNQESLPVQSLPKGIYVVKVLVDNVVVSQKVVK